MKRSQRALAAGPRSHGNGSPSASRHYANPDRTVAVQLKRLAARIDRIELDLDHIQREQLEKNGADLSVQFQRIAMMQAEIDRLKVHETALQAEVDHLRAKNSERECHDGERTAQKN